MVARAHNECFAGGVAHDRRASGRLVALSGWMAGDHLQFADAAIRIYDGVKYYVSLDARLLRECGVGRLNLRQELGGLQITAQFDTL